MNLHELNLSVANVCNADCIYCPKSLAPAPKTKFMPIELVKRIMEQITTEDFKSKHQIIQSVLSENGECMLHPDIIDIMRIVKNAGIPIMIFTNFSYLSEEKAEVIIKENLVHCIHFNMDGATQESYFASKKLNLAIVEKNVMDFLKIRNESGSNIRLFGHVISARTYTNSVLIKFREYPVKSKGREIPEACDAEQTIKKWKVILHPDKDNIGIDPVFFWAERYTREWPIVGDFSCSNIERVKHCAYINPDGDWYGCCFDIGNNLVIGNVYEQSIVEIAESEKRKSIIDMLENKRFRDIGWPCNRVDTCQGMEWT